jgi:hypothetical protein
MAARNGAARLHVGFSASGMSQNKGMILGDAGGSPAARSISLRASPVGPPSLPCGPAPLPPFPGSMQRTVSSGTPGQLACASQEH